MTPIEHRKERGINVISPNAAPHGESLFALKSTIDRCLRLNEGDAGSERVVIDLTRVGQKDHFLASAIFFILTRFPKKEEGVRIVADNDLIKKIAAKTDLFKSIRIFKSVEEAIASYEDSDSINILLVDDDEDEYVFMKDLLSEVPNSHYDLTWTPSYNEALEKIKEGNYDVCIIDYKLGERSGVELLREIGDYNPELPCVILTGLGNYFVDMEAMAAGAADYIEKGEVSASLLDRSIRYAIRGKQLEAKLRFQAIHDTLTPLYNRRCFVDQLNSTFQTALRYQTKLSLCIADLDNFKDINDLYGHSMGDEVLLYFSESIIENLREHDISGRFGGDEFSMFFPHTGSEQAVISLERIMEDMRNKEFRTESGETFRVTATFGLADITPETDNAKAFLEAADKSLYKAKESGKNMIVINGTPYKK
ncbi:MAG: diguanylate cyclase [Nitrospinota bacterium]